MNTPSQHISSRHSTTTFAGDRKATKSLLYPVEQWLISVCVNRIPKKIETYHLTVCTIAWSCIIVVSGFQYHHHSWWLWVISLAIVLQFITDVLDGEIGRRRGTGLVRWGYFMDHFLDYCFLSSLFIAYLFIFPLSFSAMIVGIFAISVAYMVLAYLSFAVTNRFQIAYYGVGPSELRLLAVCLNCFIFFFGVDFLMRVGFVLLGVSFFGVWVMVYRMHKELWQIDMAEKHKVAPQNKD